MKYKSILSLFIFLLGFGATTTSCEDMLTPDMDRYSEGFSGKDTVYFYLGILRNVQDMVEQNELLADLRSDLVTTTSYSSDSIADIINHQRGKNGDNGLLDRSAYYKVINQCNFYLAKVDTNAVKNNIYYMRREYAQVVAIRAWTYLQLVQTYGKVPFITKPVDNANTGWETNPAEGWATSDNLLDLLKDELEKAQAFEYTLGAPNYGTYNTGSVTFNSSYLRFYTDLIMGDLYLLRGQSREDYVMAAKNYYRFLKDGAKAGNRFVTSNRAVFNKRSIAGKDYYYPSITNYVSNGLAAASLNSNENITIIPSAANSTFGRVLTKTTQIYGFDPSSYNSTTGGENNASDATTSGAVSLKPNLRSRQAGPSQAYLQLCAAQTYAEVENKGTSNVESESEVEYYEGAGDARVYANVPTFETTDGKAQYIVKCAPVTNISSDGEAFNASFKYYKSLYRLSQVYLRYAEAINRAGYPRMAYAILRDGINFNKMPALADSVRYDDVNQTKQTVFYLDSATVLNATNYVGVDELRRAQDEPLYAEFIDFSSNIWSNQGIHEHGCGTSSSLDTLFCYDNTIPQRIADQNALYQALGLSASVQPAQASRADEAEGEEGDVEGEEPDRSNYVEIDPEPYQQANQDEIDAVESLIADELALETAYEGTRMFDLIRIARHKNVANSGFGTAWLAWKIARRDMPYAPFEQVTQMNNTLYSTLLNPENWYVASPVY